MDTQEIVGKFFLVLGVLSCLLTQAAWSDDHLSVDLDTGFYSDYMFRGTQLYDGISIQPSVGAAYDTDIGSFSASVWAHFSAEGRTSASTKFTEIDYTVGYERSFGALGVAVGHVWYTYPRDSDGIDNSAEVFASLSYDMVLSPSLSIYHDYDEFDAQYYELGLSHLLEVPTLGEGFAFTPFVNVGFASDADKVYADDGLVQVTFGTYFDLALGDVAITPSLNYTAESDDVAENEFWMGTSLSYSF